jgi:hypothetical protein
MVWFILVFLLVLATGVTPLLGSFNVQYSLQIMVGLFAAYFIVAWIVLMTYPMFS